MTHDRDAAEHLLLGAAAQGTGRWSQDRRLEFIDFRLCWEGRLNRSDLVEFFSISIPQASLDIARYTAMAPANLQYDRRSRVYVATPEFRALFASSDSSRFLGDLLAQATEPHLTTAPFLRWVPPVASVPTPGRTFRSEVLTAVLSAMRSGSAVKVLYQSMSRPQPIWRSIAPHALAHDGFRWHIRAYCHTRQQFLDFVLARLLEVGEFEDAAASGEADEDWHTWVPMVLMPHPKLSPSHRRAIELDYGMQDGLVEFQCRKAFLFYALRHLRLDLEDATPPSAQQIALKNRQDILKIMAHQLGG
jgi:hypothetical protein